MRKSLLTATATSALILGLAAPTVAAPVPSSYLIDPVGPAADAVFPEGVATDSHFFYVGSTTDGTIYRGDLGGTTATPFLAGGQDGRTSAVGLKVSDGFLFVAGGATGRFFVYDIDSGELVGSFLVDPAPAGDANPTFLNDAVVAPDGSVYVTDSIRPVLYRIGPDGYATDGVETLEVFLEFDGTPLQYEAGFNVNGSAATPDGQYLVLAQSNTRMLFRVELATGDVSPIDLGGALVNGDGLVLRGRTLYAVERPQTGDARIVEIMLSGDLTSGAVISLTTDESFDDPTTAAIARGRLLVVNSQFGARAPGQTPGPFTVSTIPLP
jgi:outer membrane protein assembly factor BamB